MVGENAAFKPVVEIHHAKQSSLCDQWNAQYGAQMRQLYTFAGSEARVFHCVDQKVYVRGGDLMKATGGNELFHPSQYRFRIQYIDRDSQYPHRLTHRALPFLSRGSRETVGTEDGTITPRFGVGVYSIRLRRVSGLCFRKRV